MEGMDWDGFVGCWFGNRDLGIRTWGSLWCGVATAFHCTGTCEEGFWWLKRCAVLRWAWCVCVYMYLGLRR